MLLALVEDDVCNEESVASAVLVSAGRRVHSGSYSKQSRIVQSGMAVWSMTGVCQHFESGARGVADMLSSV